MTDTSAEPPQSDKPARAAVPALRDGEHAATADADSAFKLVGVPVGTTVAGGAVLAALRAWNRRRRSRKRDRDDRSSAAMALENAHAQLRAATTPSSDVGADPLLGLSDDSPETQAGPTNIRSDDEAQDPGPVPASSSGPADQTNGTDERRGQSAETPDLSGDPPSQPVEDPSARSPSPQAEPPNDSAEVPSPATPPSGRSADNAEPLPDDTPTPLVQPARRIGPADPVAGTPVGCPPGWWPEAGRRATRARQAHRARANHRGFSMLTRSRRSRHTSSIGTPGSDSRNSDTPATAW